ncbi:MAG TPA: AMP-binding protein, partial [Dehalococcoidia bacterium]|nr:AMP-binding protein [Dehalococcoidia bacterium]
MNYDPILKLPAEKMPVVPNLIDYAAARASFHWDDIRAELDGLPGGGLNIAYECVDRHLKTHRRDKTAMLWEGKDGYTETYTFAQMAAASNKAANALRALGVEKGDRVFVFLERVPELYFAVFGALKLGAVIGPLFSAFGPDAVRDRLADSGAKVLLTSPELWARVHEIRAGLPELRHVVILDRDGGTLPEGTVAWSEVVGGQPESFEIERTDPEDFAVMHYTSGTTGKPKGAAHVHMAVLGHYATAKYVLDLHD